MGLTMWPVPGKAKSKLICSAFAAGAPKGASGSVFFGTEGVMSAFQKAKSGTINELKEVRLLCAPQAKQHLEQGVAVDHTLCNECHIPKLV
mgnify:CR=1 FL=1